MHLVGLIFLWLNRVFFAMTLIYGIRNLRLYEWEDYQKHFLYPTLAAVWQLIGTYFIPFRKMSPFHLFWWYPLGWTLLAIVGMIRTDLIRFRERRSLTK